MHTDHWSKGAQACLRPEATSLRRGAGTTAAAASASRPALCCIASAAICWYALQDQQIYTFSGLALLLHLAAGTQAHMRANMSHYHLATPSRSRAQPRKRTPAGV